MHCRHIFICPLLCFFVAIQLPCVLSQSTIFPVRTFALTSDTSFHFDLNLVIPIPVIGNITVEVEFCLPLKIHFMNSSLYYQPVKIPYLILPEPKPIVFDLRKPDKYYSYNQDPYTYDSYYEPEYNTPYYESANTWVDGNRRNLLTASENTFSKKEPKSTKKLKGKKKYSKKKKSGKKVSSAQRRHMPGSMNETLRFYHQRHKRSVAESSAQHRLDLFAVFEETLNQYGINGQACVCRAICEVAEMELIIESPLHEAVEHLLRVSRAVDSDGLLSDYLEAEQLGHRSFKAKKWNACSKRYSSCPFSVFDRSPIKVE